MEKLNIALLTDSFYPGTGGTESAVFYIADALTKKGHNVMVCAPKYWDVEDNYSFEVNRSKRLKIIENNYLPLPSISRNFQKRLEDFKPDILHCHSTASMLSYAIKFSKKHKIPLVATVHTKFKSSYYITTHSKLITRVFCKSFGRKLKKCDKVTAVSYSMRDEFDYYGYRGDFDVIKNGCTYKSVEINDELKHIAQQKYNFTDSDNILLFVGHVSQIKNVDFIFDSLLKLDKINQNFKMIFVGSIDDKKFVKKVEKSSIADKIIFTNQIADKKLLSSLYANAKIFLFPSIFDNDSLAVIESAVHGVPSMVLKNTGASERLTDDINGFIIENEQNMAEKIDFLLKNVEFLQKVGQNAKQTLPKDWIDVVPKYEELYLNVITEYNKKIGA